MFGGAVFSEEEFVLLILLFSVATVGCLVVGFAVGRWWVLLLAFVPMVFGFQAFLSLSGVSLALGVGAAKLRRLWLRRRLGEGREPGIQPSD
jgi:hypothetical protein